MTADPARELPRPTAPGELLRFAFVAGIGALSFLLSFGADPDAPVLHRGAQLAALAGALALLRLRRRYPLLVAAVLVVASAAYALLIGAALLAVVSLATWRRWWPVVAVGVLFVGTAVLDDLQDGMTGIWWEQVGLAMLVYAVCVGFGAYQGSRRALLAALRERADAAEREQVARVEQAQVAERTRIAREMHDVLAHRISLVAMHAGVLAFRTDLPDEERTATAVVVRDNANLALAELRQVLGVLRTGSGTGLAGTDPEPPQPTLAALADLVRDTGTADVRVEVAPATAAHLAALPAQLSRDAYRIVQEALTNARKHAPGGAVRVRVDGTPGGLLSVEVRNAPGSGGPSGIAGSGTGLVGVAERVRLSGGDLEHGPDGGGYRLRALLPWPEED